jgi:adenylosuccinate lyase
MAKIWTEENEFATMLQVEIFACEAMNKLGLIPDAALADIKTKSKFTVERIKEIERETNHDIIAFLTCVAEYVGDASKYIHMGMTSSDVKDTALCSMCKQAGELLLKDLQGLYAAIEKQACLHKYTVMIGRTHGIHAEPMTFGLKMAVWLDEVSRSITRLEQAIDTISVGKISGAVGTYAFAEPVIESYVCEKLGLRPAKASTQVLQRDRHATFLTAIAIIGSSLEKFSTEIRNLQRTDIREAEEYFSSGQKGSSAMPHKRNPITCERISGLARVLRGNALAAMENVALWHERDISHSSVERVILPDSTILLDYVLKLMTRVMDNLLVYPEAMKNNLEKTGGLIFSQRLLLALVEKGVLREDAYAWVQRNAMSRWLHGADFKTNFISDPDVARYLTKAEIEDCFECTHYLKHIDTIMKRFGL